MIQVKARNPDDTTELIHYSITGDGSEYFYLDTNTGKIWVNDMTGLEAGKNLKLQVTVRIISHLLNDIL